MALGVAVSGCTLYSGLPSASRTSDDNSQVVSSLSWGTLESDAGANRYCIEIAFINRYVGGVREVYPSGRGFQIKEYESAPSKVPGSLAAPSLGRLSADFSLQGKWNFDARRCCLSLYSAHRRYKVELIKVASDNNAGHGTVTRFKVVQSSYPPLRNRLFSTTTRFFACSGSQS